MSNDSMPDTSTPPDRGNIYLYNACRPPLPAGDYTLEVDHHLRISGTDHGFPARTHPFKIAGPRFTLDPNEIHAAYPPPNSEGRFATRLPMVVLRRRTLPWERQLDPGGPLDDAKPWLALLLFEEGEITLLDPPNCTVRDVLWPSTSGITKVPSPFWATVPTEERDRPCLGLEVSLNLFQAVAPMADEIPLLTHVRQVNTKDKELLGMDKDGWFAVVVGNRLPEGSAIHEPGKKYHACLVSLEGREDRLPDDHPVYTGGGTAPIDDSGNRIRLIVLARWEFKCKGAGDFQSLMKDIPKKGGVAMLGMSPQDAVLPGVTPETSYQVALDSGHVPLPHRTRHGEQSVAWYRGPLVPVGVARDSTGPYHTADQARRIDPLTGLENLGYAAAFEIGRLLALSDPRFALELLRWRRGDYDRVAGKAGWRHRIPDILDIDLARILLREELRMMTDSLIDLFGDILLDPNFGLVDPTGFGPWANAMEGLKPDMLDLAWGLEPGISENFFQEGMLGDMREEMGKFGLLDDSMDPAEIGRNVERLTIKREEFLDRRSSMTDPRTDQILTEVYECLETLEPEHMREETRDERPR